ncbi:MBL fold metallo-hydrolase [Candidatus Palauibacter sp.]|uniref:MBL fold metallo-hydrolase n=1 Tax=Candidatus Palauibacter sp. TaxID=3101350 RepID=UPI003B02901A
MTARPQRPERTRTGAICRPGAIPAIMLGAAWLCAGCAPGGDDRSGAEGGGTSTTEAVHFEFTEVVPGVYHARGASDLVVGSNAGVVVNEADVLLVDSHISPAAANALIEDLRSLTDKPVRYAANTHWHFDHAHGNQVYPPDVEIISHEATRAAIAEGRSNSGRSYELFVGSIPGRIEQMEATLDTLTDAAARAELEAQLEGQRTYYAQLQEVVPTPPNTTLSERLTLYRGGREIQFHFFGRAHTEGDVIVYLPGDRVIISGDMLTGGLPYMGDGYVNEWVETLERVKALDFDWIIPGHGAPYQERERIDHLQAYLLDLWDQSVALHGQGVNAEDAAARIDLTAHAANFGGISGPGANPVAVLRIFELLDGTAN